jgi:hypothetical protein
VVYVALGFIGFFTLSVIGAFIKADSEKGDTVPSLSPINILNPRVVFFTIIIIKNFAPTLARQWWACERALA